MGGFGSCRHRAGWRNVRWRRTLSLYACQAWFALRFDRLIGRPLARPAVGCWRSVAELLPVITWLFTSVFCCCPADSRRPLQPV
ncbi:hypothetical protein FHJ30_20675 [Arthrobacter sp. BB-1]|nr:hypothetical protein FHJ30_20675 [Arthrobacter sp. BB-1]